MKTFNDYMITGELPVLSENYYKMVCDELGLPFTGVNQVLKEDQFERLKNDPEIIYILFEQKARKLDFDYMSSCNKLISDAHNALSKLDEKGLSKKSQPINDLIDDLERQRNLHESKVLKSVNGEEISPEKEYLNKIQSSRLDQIDYKIFDNGDKLKNEYVKIDKIKKSLASYKTSLKKKKLKKKLEEAKKRIARLQKKQGKLIETRNRIVNKGIEKYKKIKNEQLRQYSEVIMSEDKFIESVSQIKSSIHDINDDIKLTTDELSKSNLTKFQKIGLKRDLAGLNKEKEKLKSERRKIERARNLQIRLALLRNKTSVLGNGVQMPENGKTI